MRCSMSESETCPIEIFAKEVVVGQHVSRASLHAFDPYATSARIPFMTSLSLRLEWMRIGHLVISANSRAYRLGENPMVRLNAVLKACSDV